MSIGFLIDTDTPMVWRGPMVTQALEQLLKDTTWRDLDYLIVDMPPGTGDIQLTLAQKVPVTGVVIVTTPQDIALIDARKGLKMFEKVGIPILGIVENMSTHICSQCGHEEHIFGQGGAERMCKEYGDRKSTRLNSSHGYISYAVFCLKKKKLESHVGLAFPLLPHVGKILVSYRVHPF